MALTQQYCSTRTLDRMSSCQQDDGRDQREQRGVPVVGETVDAVDEDDKHEGRPVALAVGQLRLVSRTRVRRRRGA
jgi:hypothetical protein